MKKSKTKTTTKEREKKGKKSFSFLSVFLFLDTNFLSYFTSLDYSHFSFVEERSAMETVSTPGTLNIPQIVCKINLYFISK